MRKTEQMKRYSLHHRSGHNMFGQTAKQTKSAPPGFAKPVDIVRVSLGHLKSGPAKYLAKSQRLMQGRRDERIKREQQGENDLHLSDLEDANGQSDGDGWPPLAQPDARDVERTRASIGSSMAASSQVPMRSSLTTMSSFRSSSFTLGGSKEATTSTGHRDSVVEQGGSELVQRYNHSKTEGIHLIFEDYSTNGRMDLVSFRRFVRDMAIYPDRREFAPLWLEVAFFQAVCGSAPGSSDQLSLLASRRRSDVETLSLSLDAWLDSLWYLARVWFKVAHNATLVELSQATRRFRDEIVLAGSKNPALQNPVFCMMGPKAKALLHKRRWTLSVILWHYSKCGQWEPPDLQSPSEARMNLSQFLTFCYHFDLVPSACSEETARWIFFDSNRGEFADFDNRTLSIDKFLEALTRVALVSQPPPSVEYGKSIARLKQPAVCFDAPPAVSMQPKANASLRKTAADIASRRHNL